MVDNYEMFNFAFNEFFLQEYDEEELKEKRKDYCYKCDTEELYTHAMTFKCSRCHSIILGGD